MVPLLFEPFALLHKELQLLIWEEAVKLVLPRVILLEKRRRRSASDSDSTQSSITTSTPCHPLFHVCQDSRKTMLREWPLRFGTADGKHKAHVPFNSKIDTLYFMNDIKAHDFATHMTTQDRLAVKQIATNCEGSQRYLDWRSIELIQEDFPSLENLSFPTPIIGGKLVNYTELFEVNQRDQDDVMPYLISLGKSPVEETDLLVNVGQPMKIHFEAFLIAGFIGLQVDFWGYPLELFGRQRLGKGCSEVSLNQATRCSSLEKQVVAPRSWSGLDTSKKRQKRGR